MRRLIKKIHMYAGLFSFTAFIVYGAAGLHATFPVAPRARPGGERYVDFIAPGGMSDKEVADQVYRAIDLPLTGPVPGYALRRDASQHLRLNFYTPNGTRRVTVLEEEHRLRIESDRSRLLPFMDNLHSATVANASPRFLMLAWGWYNEVAIWSLLLMSVSGVYLWLASRPGHRWAQIAMAAGTGAFLVLYWVTR